MEVRAWTLLNELSARIPSVREPVASLSGGQRQTVAIARSLLLDPKIIMLDEPTAALGVAQTAEVLNLIERVRDRGLGVIMISHNMEDVRAVADRSSCCGSAATTASSRRDASNEELVGAITGATDNVGRARRRGARRAVDHDHRGGPSREPTSTPHARTSRSTAATSASSARGRSRRGQRPSSTASARATSARCR